ncbi:MAG: hypothetical protein QM802_20640 [Agriterribacter sp.]
MENEEIKILLNEILTEQSAYSKETNALQKAVEELTRTVKDFNKRLDGLQSPQSGIDGAQMHIIMRTYTEEIKKIIAQQPKDILQEKRYLFFPEHQAKEYYGTVLRWLLYMLITTYSFLLLRNFMSHWI